jgi:hypothetical protein
MSPVRDVPESRPKGSELRVGEPLEAGAWKIRPVVRVGDGRGPGVSLRAELAEVIVLGDDGQEYRVPTPDRTRSVLWGLAGVALMVPIASQVAVRVLR